ncbi:hypothetical protein BDZ94DRAFT_1262624 [Collybia nuda]|uniref:Uncharacterized protein n=1 Tax=Collybia nuda TaxID=64659 RepID=A0A9P6CIK4_9AGAR|nr:hypothetical protein BDZ94DRAFT_1262624 [Collybia nuda]
MIPVFVDLCEPFPRPPKRRIMMLMNRLCRNKKSRSGPAEPTRALGRRGYFQDSKLL